MDRGKQHAAGHDQDPGAGGTLDPRGQSGVVFVVTPSTNNEKRLLPDESSYNPGDEVVVANDHASNNLLVQNSADSATIATVGNGEVAKVILGRDGTSNIWTATVFT